MSISNKSVYDIEKSKRQQRCALESEVWQLCIHMITTVAVSVAAPGLLISRINVQRIEKPIEHRDFDI